MDLREQAKNKLDKLSTSDIMCAFDIIGRDYLDSDMILKKMNGECAEFIMRC